MTQLSYLRSQYLDQPFEVSLETLALCNAACRFCPYPTLERKGTSLSNETLARLLLEMSTWEKPFFISPFKVNEPLLDKRLFEFCGSINRLIPRANIRLFTNGSPLTPEVINNIDILDNIVHLWISLNSHDPWEYHHIMRLNFEQTAKKLDFLHKQSSQGYFRHPVVLSKVSTTTNEGAFMTYCAERWPYFQPIIIKQDGWLGYVDPMSPEIPDTPCLRWFELSILATGEVSLCCMDGEGAFPIGNVHMQTLLEIYNSPQWRDRRERMISRKEIHPCATCTY